MKSNVKLICFAIDALFGVFKGTFWIGGQCFELAGFTIGGVLYLDN